MFYSEGLGNYVTSTEKDGKYLMALRAEVYGRPSATTKIGA